MLRRSLAVLGVLLPIFGLFAPPAALAGPFAFTTITVPNQDNTGPTSGINGSGQIVGRSHNNFTVFGHGYLLSGGTFTTIDFPGAVGFGTTAAGINDSGQIAGTYDSSFSNFHGFSRDVGGTFTPFDVPGAGGNSGTQPQGVNNSGQIVGLFTDGTNKNHGFLLSGGTFTTIDVPGATGTQASGINNLGQIVGNFGDSTGGHGFLLSGGTFTTIDVPGATGTQASGINNLGQIVGGFGDSTGGHGFLLSGGTFTTIDVDVPGAIPGTTQARGINDSGQIVGDYTCSACTLAGTLTGARGFLATPTTVPFAAFSAKVEIQLLAGAFEVNSAFTLGTGSNGIAPLTEDLTLHVGTFSTTIPASSFIKDKKGRFKFEGTINGVSLEAVIAPLGGSSFAFKAEGTGANLTGTVNPVTLGLTIGNDGGSISVTAEFE